MPSNRKQKAKEKRSRQPDVMSDIENMDVVLGNFPQNSFERPEVACEIEVDIESRRLHRDTNQIGDNFRKLLHTNASEISEITSESRRAITSEISSQMSRKRLV